MDASDARKTILSRRAKFVAAAIAAAGIAIVDESRSRGAPPSSPPARDAGASSIDGGRRATRGDAAAAATSGDWLSAALDRARALSLEGKLIEAIELIKSELADAGAPLVPGKTPEFRERLAPLHALLNELAVRCPTIVVVARAENGREPERDFFVDGVLRGSTNGQPLMINPGEHTITVHRDEDAGVVEERIMIREGEKSLVVRLEAGVPRPCLQPLHHDDELYGRGGSHGCSCDVPGITKLRSTD